MKTWWVSTLGDNANAGDSYAAAKATLNGATGALSVASQGDTINIVNDGVHDCVPLAGLTAIQHVGTDWTTNPGLIIRGTDSSENPARTSVKASATNLYFIYVWAGSTGNKGQYIKVEGLSFDYSALPGTSITAFSPLRYSGNVGSQKILDCEFLYTGSLGSSINITNTNPFYPIEWTGASPPLSAAQEIEIAGCYFQGACYLTLQTIEKMTYDVHHNVFIFDVGSNAAAELAALFPVSSTTQMIRKFYHNTIFFKRYTTDKPESVIVDSSTTDTQYLYTHSNIFYYECGPSAATPGITGPILQGTTGAATGVGIGRYGYNGIYLGTNISAFWSAWSGVPGPGLYSFQFNPIYRSGVGTQSGQDTESTDSLRKSVAESDVFSDTTATYAWTRTGSNYPAITLPYDLRPLNDPKVARDGTPPGALPAALTPPDPGTDPGIDPVSDLDSVPFFREVPRINLQAMMKFNRNGNPMNMDLRHYLQDDYYDEDCGRAAVVGTASSKSFTLDGVNEATVFMLWVDTSVDVVITTLTQTFNVTVDEALVIHGGGVHSFQVTNNGASSALVRFMAVQ